MALARLLAMFRPGPGHRGRCASHGQKDHQCSKYEATAIGNILPTVSFVDFDSLFCRQPAIPDQSPVPSGAASIDILTAGVQSSKNTPPRQNHLHSAPPFFRHVLQPAFSALNVVAGGGAKRYARFFPLHHSRDSLPSGFLHWRHHQSGVAGAGSRA